MLGMVIFTILEFGLNSLNPPLVITLLISMVDYFLIVFLYYGIATLAFQKHTWLLWGSAVAIYVIAYMFTGISTVWVVLSEWSMILFGGVVIGRLTLKHLEHKKVYTFGMIAVIIFALAMFAPLWNLVMTDFSSFANEMIESGKQTLPSAGYSAEEVATLLTSFDKVIGFITRIIPALLILGSVFQFSIGYLLFAFLLQRKYPASRPVMPFTLWKMPFYVTVILLMGAVMHFFGNEPLKQIGDNILTFLSVFYCIFGLSLIEHYLRRFKMHPVFRLGFYILLFLTQMVGFFVAVFLGFIDSFKDFRNIEQLKLKKE